MSRISLRKTSSGCTRSIGDADAAGITEEELQQAKNKVKARVVLGSERPQSRLFNVGGNWLQRREYRSVADDLASLDAVTVGRYCGRC